MTQTVPSMPPRRRRPTRAWILLAGAAALAVFYFIVRNNPPARFGFADGETPRLIILGAILLLLLAGLLGRGITLGYLARSAIAWLVAIVAIVGVYANRDQLAVIGGRILGALAPGVAIDGKLAGLEDARSVAIARSGGGHFVVFARVEDKPVTFMLDTGASFVTLTQPVARMVGVDVADLRYNIPIQTANGATLAAPVTIDKLDVGGIERRHVRALVAKPDALDVSLLGMTFLDTLSSYTISGDRLILTP